MKVFIIKSINLLIAVGIIAAYCLNTQKIENAIQEKEKSQNYQEQESGQTYFAEDGIYEGSGDGFGGKINVRLTVNKNKLEKAEIISAKQETKDYLESAKKILDDAVKKQSVEVDTVSGATLSSNGIISAMKDALANGKKK